jgi:hypothetical protein
LLRFLEQSNVVEFRVTILLAALGVLAACNRSPEAQLRHTLATQSSGTIQLPPGTTEVSSELTLARGAHDLEITGAPAGSILKASPSFHGRALLVLDQVANIRVRDFSVEGNRETSPRTLEMAPPENYFRMWYTGNGILADQVDGLAISGVHLAHITNFPILVSRSQNIAISKAVIADSGSRNAMGRNNLSGGILIEEGSAHFEVRDSTFQNIAGNALWTHSLRITPRLADGVFSGNHIDTVGRDGIQVGAATRVLVEDDTISNVGFPVELVDVEHAGTPAGIDTAGNVDASVYQRNRLSEIDGKCLDLDGFHDGAIRDNTCVNRKPPGSYVFGHFGVVMNNTDPGMRSHNIHVTGNTFEGMKFGGLFLIGSGHLIAMNKFLNLDTAGCNASAATFGCIYKKDEPEMLESGIYLGRAAEHPADTRGNIIRDNLITGHGMKLHCIQAAPGVELKSQTIKGNTCADVDPPR